MTFCTIGHLTLQYSTVKENLGSADIEAAAKVNENLIEDKSAYVGTGQDAGRAMAGVKANRSILAGLCNALKKLFGKIFFFWRSAPQPAPATLAQNPCSPLQFADQKHIVPVSPTSRIYVVDGSSGQCRIKVGQAKNNRIVWSVYDGALNQNNANLVAKNIFHTYMKKARSGKDVGFPGVYAHLLGKNSAAPNTQTTSTSSNNAAVPFLPESAAAVSAKAVPVIAQKPNQVLASIRGGATLKKPQEVDDDKKKNSALTPTDAMNSRFKEFFSSGAKLNPLDATKVEEEKKARELKQQQKQQQQQKQPPPVDFFSALREKFKNANPGDAKSEDEVSDESNTDWC